MYAQIDNATGEIRATTKLEVKAPMPEGVTQIQTDLNVDGLSHKYNFQTGEFEKLPPPPPDIGVQIFELLLTKGIVREDDIHPDTKRMVDRIRAERA